MLIAHLRIQELGQRKKQKNSYDFSHGTFPIPCV